MFQFLVLFGKDDELATIIRVWADTMEIVRERFPSAKRIIKC